MNQEDSPHSTAPLKINEKRAVSQNKILLCNTRNYESHDHAIIYCGIDSLWKISSETHMNQENSPHSTAPLKSNEKRAVFIKIRFC